MSALPLAATQIAVVGAGLIGRAWAISFARAGAEVRLWDQDAKTSAAALAFIDGILPELDRNGLLQDSPTDVLSRCRVASTLAEALMGAVHVQENTPEVLSTKIAVFRQLDELADAGTVIASSTSALLPSKFTEGLRGRARCLVVHPINPPYLIPAAEVVPALWTSADVVERTRALLVAAGHAPLVMKKELDGFIMNRLQGALLEEAFRLVADGYATIEDVDTGLRDGLALRWSFMGPFETIDLNAPGGIRDYVNRYQSIYSNIFPQMQRRVDWAGPLMDQIEPARRAILPADRMQQRHVWRDRRLMALVAHKKEMAKKD